MYKILYLPHTADTRIKVEADTLEDLFIGSASAINQLLKPHYCDDANDLMIWHSIEVKSIELTTLLIDFLSEILTLSHIEKVIFCEIEIEPVNKKCVKATLKGKPVEGFGEDIKAITYHEANVHMNKELNWETVVIVDI